MIISVAFSPPPPDSYWTESTSRRGFVGEGGGGAPVVVADREQAGFADAPGIASRPGHVKARRGVRLTFVAQLLSTRAAGTRNAAVGAHLAEQSEGQT